MKKLRILHLEDSRTDASLVGEVLKRDSVDAEITVARGAGDFLSTIAMQRLDLILLDNGMPAFTGTAALNAARVLIPEVPVIIVSGSADERRISDGLKSGACDYVSKNHLHQLPAAVRRAVSRTDNQEVGLDPVLHQDHLKPQF